MSMVVRQELAAAATSVEGVVCTPTYTQLSAPGQACVRLDRHEYPNPFGAVVHWNVVICLGQDMAAAETFFEAKVPLVVEALAPVLVVTSATPQQLNLADGTSVLAAFVNGHREA
ncbi:hypothetical protein [Nocardioides sp.]|uniref:hypothetical protein n=1 Tax=Nocardioides sp. TaxID=35761 RepID=UPI00262FBB9A|nr:hypothetical protein [Nocardioides sp.]MDI6908639.1 hypothetical protein [Nocardioides sp.]